ncbi:MAG: substrate-binding periplasmic protein, partial [bacterium]
MRSKTHARCQPLLLPVVVVAATILLAACGSDNDETTRSEAPSADLKILKAGVTLDFTPMQFVDSNANEVGFEIEVLEEALKRIGYEPDYVKTSFEQLITGLQADKYDIALSAIFIRCERLDSGDFTVPFFDSGQLVFGPKEDVGGVESFADLNGKVLAYAGDGTTSQKVAEENQSTGGYSLAQFADNDAEYLGLAAGRADFGIESESVTRYQLSTNHPELAAAFVVPGTTRSVGFMFDKGDPLRSEFDDVINEMKADGTLEAAYTEWFGPP